MLLADVSVSILIQKKRQPAITGRVETPEWGSQKAQRVILDSATLRARGTVDTRRAGARSFQ